MEESLKNKAVKGGMWSGVEHFSTQGMQFVFSILLARLLSPDDYGVVALTFVFFQVSGSLIDCGFGEALVRKPDRSDKDISTCFYFNIVVSIGAYSLLYLCAPFIASFYDKPILVPIIRISGISLLFSSFSIVQRTRFTYNVDFKSLAKVSLVTVFVSGIAGVIFAYIGMGVWSLVIQNVVGSFVSMVMLNLISKWKPTFSFSKDSFRYLFGYGSKLTMSYLIGSIYENLYSIVIGKFYSSAQLGLFNRAQTLGKLPSANITAIIQRVSFPILSLIQNDEDRIRTDFRRLIRFAAFIVFPSTIGLAVLAHPLIRLLLTPKWEGCVCFMQILSLDLMLYPIHAINLNVLQVIGRSDIFFKLEIIKRAIGVLVLCITINYGLVVMCYGIVAVSYIGLIFNTYYNGRIFGVGLMTQIKDLFPIIANTMIMGLLVLCLTNLLDSDLLKLLVGIVVGISVYLVGAYLFLTEDLIYLYQMIPKKK